MDTQIRKKTMDNITPTPNKMSIEVGDKILTITDTSNPTWFGDYHDGKLAVYVAQVEPPDSASTTVISTYTQHKGEDFMIYATYEENVPILDIVCHIQEQLFTAYINNLPAVIAATQQNPNTLH